MTHDPREALEPCPFCGGRGFAAITTWNARLASRQEVSVTVEELATLLIDCWKSGKAPLQVARALLANYSIITKRTTEG